MNLFIVGHFSELWVRFWATEGVVETPPKVKAIRLNARIKFFIFSKLPFKNSLPTKLLTNIWVGSKCNLTQNIINIKKIDQNF